VSVAAVVVIAALILMALILMALLGSRRRPPPQRRRGSRRPQPSYGPRTPRPGEVWFVNYPYGDDWTKAKDRPALVVSVTEHTAVVRKITSQDQSGRPREYDALPRGAGGLNKPSWVRKAPDNVALRHFRRRIGTLDSRNRTTA
jgi:hypothetical protein